MKKEYVLTFSCRDQKGIQAKTSNFLFSNNAFLTDVQSYSDEKTQSFFSRIVFSFDDLDGIASNFMNEFDGLAKELSMKWNINDLNKNNLWDTGDFLKKIKPEPTYHYNDTIKVRANWVIRERL